MKRLYHTIRYSNGSWHAFGDVNGVAGLTGTVQSVAPSFSFDGVHVTVTNTSGAA